MRCQLKKLSHWASVRQFCTTMVEREKRKQVDKAKNYQIDRRKKYRREKVTVEFVSEGGS